jgi:hypothetical protein
MVDHATYFSRIDSGGVPYFPPPLVDYSGSNASISDQEARALAAGGEA